jgi:hypothetical protein
METCTHSPLILTYPREKANIYNGHQTFLLLQSPTSEERQIIIQQSPIYPQTEEDSFSEKVQIGDKINSLGYSKPIRIILYDFL